MYSEMDYYWISSSSQPCLLEYDIELVKDALYLILNSINERSAPPEAVQIAYELNNYLKECNNSFLASERIRVFLLLSLFACLAISLISLATLPITAVSISLFCIVSFMLVSVNFFTSYNQMSGYQQEINQNKLKTHCSEYAEKLYLGKFKQTRTNTLGKISSPTSTACLFPARNIPQNDTFRPNTDENSFNNLENHLPRIDENSHESSIESNDSSRLLFMNK